MVALTSKESDYQAPGPNEHVKNVLNEGPWPEDSEDTLHRFGLKWTARQAEPILKETMPYAQCMTACYLRLWAKALASFNISPFLPEGMKEWDSGRWDFSFNEGRGNTWWIGNENENYWVMPKVSSYKGAGGGAFEIGGKYDFWAGGKHNEGRVIIAVEGVRWGKECKVRFFHEGNMYGPINYEGHASCTFNTPERTIEYRNGDFYVWQRAFDAQRYRWGGSTWYPGVQFAVHMGGQRYDIYFELMKHIHM